VAASSEVDRSVETHLLWICVPTQMAQRIQWDRTTGGEWATRKGMERGIETKQK